MKKIAFFLLAIILFISCKKEPVADFTVVGSTAVGGELVFENNSSHSSSYLWDFGDNTTSNLSVPTHVFQKPGHYTVTLTATGDGGSSSINKALNITGTTYSFKNVSDYDLPQFCSYYWNGNDIIYFVEHGMLSAGHETEIVIAHSTEVEAGFIDGDIVYIIPGPFPLISGQHNVLEINNQTPIYSGKGIAENNTVEVFRRYFQKQ
jgi:PKD repeat protein